MDASQISELATTVLDWTAASSPELIPQRETLGGQAASFVNRTFEHDTRPEALQSSCNYFPGITNMAGFVPSNDISSQLEQVPMDDCDPLDSFSFWDGENFYTNQEYSAVCSPGSDMNSEIFQFSGYMMDDDSLGRNDILGNKGHPDLLHGNNPTLAELNSCGETLLDYTVDSSFVCEDVNNSLSADMLSKSLPSNDQFLSYFGNVPVSNNSTYFLNTACVPVNTIDTRNNLQGGLISSSCPASSSAILCPQYLSVCDDKFLLCPQNSPASDSFFAKQPEYFSNKLAVPMNEPVSMGPMFLDSKLPDASLLSSSAPPDITMSSFLHKVKVEGPASGLGCKAMHSSERSLSGFSSLSLSNDDESGSYFDDSDRDEDDDFSSDEDVFQYESDEILSTSWPPGKDVKNPSQRKHRYFWQYNLQSRGVKTPSLLPVAESGDPHILNDALDPVFAEECTLPVKHSGKARKGDGNDLTPNPYKLFKIGVELKKLNRLIYSLNPGCESSDSKPLSRKEKNKLASRVCRLKKKAQHEANKIKLYGLQQEHKKLVNIIMETRQIIQYKIKNFHKIKSLSCSQWLENYLQLHDPRKVAEKSSEFVNEVLEKVAKGEADGGLGKL